MDWISSGETWAALATLTFLEIVLGIDNIVFIAILVAKLPNAQQATARTIGLSLAMVSRILLLLSLAWIMRLTSPLFAVLGHGVSGRDLILLAGGLFLIWKSIREVRHHLRGEVSSRGARAAVSFGGVLVQIALLDIVFSLDSVITAVGMANQLAIMIAAIVLAVGFMMFASGPLSTFVDRHPTFKTLALAVLLLVGGTLIAEGAGVHISKDAVYFAIGFSVFVEILNLRARDVKKIL